MNVASRMEANGEAGKVNISETTYQHIKDYFQCTYRGKIPAKSIGEINMYFVERILPEYSEDEHGFVPNALFRKEPGQILGTSDDLLAFIDYDQQPVVLM